MSASTVVTIMCDAPSCGEWSERGQGDTAAEARRNLKGTGWTLGVPTDGTRKRLDFCPQHPQDRTTP